MIVYWGGLIASVWIAYLGTHVPVGQRHRRLVAFFCVLPLFLIAALRYDVGEDYLSYAAYFETVRDAYNAGFQRLEPLYHQINEIVAWLHGDSGWVFAASAGLFFAFVFSQIFRASPYPALSVFLLVTMGYYYVSFNAMRQMIGCGLLLFSIRYIQRKSPVRFFACVAIAVGFHTSCALFAIAYWVGRIKIRPAAALVSSALVVILNQAITTALRDIIALTQYGGYLASVFDTGETAYVMLAMNAVLLVFASMCYQDDAEYRIYYNFQLIALWITIFSGNVALFLRLLWMFGLPSVLLLPMAISRIPKERNRNIVMAIIVLLYSVYMTYTVGMQNSNSVLPYQTILGR